MKKKRERNGWWRRKIIVTIYHGQRHPRHRPTAELKYGRGELTFICMRYGDCTIKISLYSPYWLFSSLRCCCSQMESEQTSRDEHASAIKLMMNIKKAFTKVNWLFSFLLFADCELEELEAPQRYRPDSLAQICKTTKFSEPEIKRMYRGFKAHCPNGMVKEDTFKVIYAQFFPQGGSYSITAWFVVAAGAAGKKNFRAEKSLKLFPSKSDESFEDGTGCRCWLGSLTQDELNFFLFLKPSNYEKSFSQSDAKSYFLATSAWLPMVTRHASTST